MHGSIADGSDWRGALLDRLHRTLVLLSVPTFVLIVLGRGVAAFGRFEVVTLLLFVAAAGLYALRARLDQRSRARALIVVVLALGSYFDWNTGLTSGVVLLHVLAGIVAALCLGQRAALLAMAYSITSAWAINASISLFGHVPPLAAMMDAAVLLTWVRMTLVFSVLGAVIVGSLAYAIARVDLAMATQARAIAQLQDEIARRQRAELERERAHAELLRTQKAETISMLSAGLAHDFNNALMVILGTSDVLRADVQSQSAREDLDMIIHAAQSAAGLSRSLLAVAKRTPLSKQPLRLDQFLSAAGRTLERALPRSIQVKVDAGEVPQVLGDASQLDHVLLNLVFNARDAMPDGGQLHVRTLLGAPPGAPAGSAPWVALQVRDTGTGIADAIKARLFEPFVSTKGERGTGLGLASVHAIVTELGGTVSVDSAVGRGTTFTLWFPPLPEAGAEPGPVRRVAVSV